MFACVGQLVIGLGRRSKILKDEDNNLQRILSITDQDIELYRIVYNEVENWI